MLLHSSVYNFIFLALAVLGNTSTTAIEIGYFDGDIIMRCFKFPPTDDSEVLFDDMLKGLININTISGRLRTISEIYDQSEIYVEDPEIHVTASCCYDVTTRPQNLAAIGNRMWM